MTTSLQRIAAAEDLFHGPSRPLSAEDWQAKCIAARTQLVQAKDRLKDAHLEISGLRNARASNEALLSNQRSRIKFLQDTLEIVQRNHDEEVARLNARISELETARAGTPPQSRPSHASDADAAQMAMVIPALQVAS